DVAARVGGKKASRSAVEIGDRRLNLGEARLFAYAIGVDFIDLPHDKSAFAPRARVWRHGLNQDAEPTGRKPRFVLAFARRRQAEIFFQGAALLRRASKTKDRFRQMRIASEGAVGRRHVRLGIEP